MKKIFFTGTSEENLLKKISEELNFQLGNLKKSITKPTKKYLTRKDVSELLEVNLSTLHNWKKSNILKPKKIGSRVYYLLSDIEKLLKN